MTDALREYIVGLALDAEKHGKLMQLVAVSELDSMASSKDAAAKKSIELNKARARISELEGEIATLEKRVRDMERDYTRFSPSLEVVNLG